MKKGVGQEHLRWREWQVEGCQAGMNVACVNRIPSRLSWLDLRE